MNSTDQVIELKPEIENHFICPECKAEDPVVKEVLLQPIYVLADCMCKNCRLEFYQTFPVGHSVEEHLSIEKSGKLYLNSQNQSWLSEALRKTYQLVEDDDLPIERRIFRECKNVVILNTLDYLYGHVLLKLYNAQYHLDHQKDLGLVVIIPKSFEWLIPTGCAEAWIVDLKLSELSYGHEAIQKFVSREFERFYKIYLSKAYSHPDFTTVDIERFTGIKPFDLNLFQESKPTITFILREDRWWYGGVPDYWFYRVCRKLKILSWGSRILSHWQNRLVKSTIKHIRKKLPDAELIIAGLGETGSFNGFARDERTINVNASTEMNWCKIYARSHVVIGIHGSNMLLPTAFAAGCIEILPTDRFMNMVQDISVRYNDRKQLFFYRFADEYAKPKSIAAKAVAVITDFSEFNTNMCRNVYPVDR
jgi:hypothetical protein